MCRLLRRGSSTSIAEEPARARSEHLLHAMVVEAAGVGLNAHAENKQVIDFNGLPETQETAKTRFSSTRLVHGIPQSSPLPSGARFQRTDEAHGGVILRLLARGATGQVVRL